MQWLIPLAMGTWAVLTWAHGREQEREKQRMRITALYVNPFLSACEDLQSRIYKILELGGLDVLKERYPDGSYAEETLYLIVRYFGWSAAVNRYGPYTQGSDGDRTDAPLYARHLPLQQRDIRLDHLISSCPSRRRSAR